MTKLPKNLPVIAVAVATVVAVIAYLVNKLGDVNKGTAFEGTGAIGTLGHAADALSGGALSSTGSAIGGALFDLTHSDYANAITYTFAFRDGPYAGKNGAVNADEVDSDTGIFAYYKDGVQYRLQKDSSGNKFATKV